MSEETLRHTALRHKMLAEIAAGTPEAGGVTRLLGWSGQAKFSRHVPGEYFTNDLSGPERRTVGDLYHRRYAKAGHAFGASMYSVRLLRLTVTGHDLLKLWDSEHGGEAA